MIKTAKRSKPYTILAKVYDEVMSRVDYELWADFIHEIITVHHPGADAVLELACGTGGLTFEIEKLNNFEITATDKSNKMVEKAQMKADQVESGVQFEQEDFLNIQMNQKFDAVFSVFDSVNYLLTEHDLLEMFEQVATVMKPTSIFIFDFTTPLNSRESIHFLNNREGTTENGWHYFRKSRYDSEQQIHYNTFEIEKPNSNGKKEVQTFSEKHKQRAYTLAEMKSVINKSDFTIKAKYGEFDMREADKNSHRITLVLQ